MDSVIIPLDERLAAPGDSRSLNGSLGAFEIELGSHHFDFPAGLTYDVVLTNAGDGILASGIVRSVAHSSCDRCLEDAELTLAAELDEYYLFEAPAENAQEDDDDDIDYLFVSDDNSIDLSVALDSALIMELPFVVLCKEDCAGLCPVCGQNLNEGDCGHALELEEKRKEESLRENPFSVLSTLKFDEDA